MTKEKVDYEVVKELDELVEMNLNEIKAIKNSISETPVDISQRNKKFDLNFNDINYNLKIRDLLKSVQEFSTTYTDQLLTLAMGGHDCAVKLAATDILWDMMEKECKNNNFINSLRCFHYTLQDFSEELGSMISEQKQFITKQEFMVFMD